MKLTPLDIHHKEFRRAIRGYSEEEVDVFLDQVAEEFERVFKENIELKEQSEGMKEKVKQYEGVEQTLQRALFTAQQAADEVQNNAKKEAELIIKDAELKAKEIIQNILTDKQNLQSELGGLKGAEKEFRDKFKHLLTQYLDVINKVEKGERVEAPVEEEPVVEAAPGLNLAPEPEPEPEPEPYYQPETDQRETESPASDDLDKPEAESASAGGGITFETQAPPVDAGPVAQFSASAPDLGYGGSVGNDAVAPVVEVAPTAVAPEMESPKAPNDDFQVSFDRPAADTAPPAAETLVADPAPPGVSPAPAPVNDDQFFSLDQDVPEFNPAPQRKPEDPIEVASSVSSFFDDDLGVDEEEKKDDWSASRPPLDGEIKPGDTNNGNN